MFPLPKHLRTSLAFTVVIVCLLAFTSIAAACPGCKDALAESDPNQSRIVKGYFWSILFMMSMPFAITGTFGTYIYLEIRRARADQALLAANQDAQ